MNLNLSGKTALVCGSTQGIGWASALELALLGANVILLARNETKLQECLKMLPVISEQSHSYLVADFNEPENVKAQVSHLIESGKIIHILINNTGGPSGGSLIDESPEKFLSVFNQHLIINQFLAQLVFPGMQKVNFGRIINVISVSVKQPIIGLGVSNTVRWAVASWAKTLSKELGIYGITVNNVLPGFTATQRLEQVNNMRAKNLNISVEAVEESLKKDIPSGRFATAEELAAAVVFLCSPAAASINGINLPVDGGYSNSL